MVKKKEEEEEELPIYEIWSPAKLAQVLGGLGPTLLELHERCKYGAIAGCTFLRETICRTAEKSFDSPYPYVWDAFRTALAQARLLTISKDLAALHREYGERIKEVERDYFELSPREREITALSTLIMEEIPELMDAIDEFKENVTLSLAHIGGTTTYKASHIDNLTKEEIKKSKEIAKELYMAEVEGRPLKIEPVVKPPPKPKPPKKAIVYATGDIVNTKHQKEPQIIARKVDDKYLVYDTKTHLVHHVSAKEIKGFSTEEEIRGIVTPEQALEIGERLREATPPVEAELYRPEVEEEVPTEERARREILERMRRLLR